MNCITCGMVICTVPGECFTPHFKREGLFKCRQCGPFNRSDVIGAPFAIPRNEIVRDIDGGIWAFFGDQKWHAITHNGVSEFGKSALLNSDNLAPYSILGKAHGVVECNNVEPPLFSCKFCHRVMCSC